LIINVPSRSVTDQKLDRARALAVIGALSLTLAGAIVAAAWRSGWGTVAALAASLVVELVVSRGRATTVDALGRVGFGPAVRTAVRMIAVVLLAGRCLPPHQLVGAAATAGVVTGAAVAVEAARIVVVRARRLPLITRNIDLGGLALPPPPPGFALTETGWAALGPVCAAVGLTIAIRHNASPAATAIGLAACTVVIAVPLLLLVPQVATLLRGRLRARMTEAARAAVGVLAPRVLLYFDASPAELYQVRMWLEPLSRLEHQVALLVRSHEVFEALADVPLPTVCTPYNGTVASLPLPSRVAGLFVTHTGNNLSLLRRAEVRSVFVGHGDSDKPDSVNPFARVYDEVWVAGPLARRRYARAAVGVADSAVVEVGRPQQGLVASRPTDPPTVVYAPTWEGWGDDPHHSSLAQVGPTLVERLVAVPEIQVRYRPHPLTGRRSAELRAAHQRIVELVGQVPADESLADTFAASSGLVADVSSVVNEYLLYDRPYAVVDSRDVGRQAFVSGHPSSAGGFVLPPDLDGLEDFVSAVLGGSDASRTARRELVADALGDPATAQHRFAAAVDRTLDA
jgi:HAMP domain-containing protein